MNEGYKGTYLLMTFPWALVALFAVLRLTHVIGWSWWWVSAPVTAPFALVIVALILAAITDPLTKKRQKK